MKRYYKNISIIFSTSVLLLSLSNCNEEAVQTLPKESWELTWSDEFLGTAGDLPDATKWTYDLGNGTNGWGNSELESYTNSTNNVALDGAGNLVITAIKNGTSYSSARIKTQGLFSQAYGKIEARIKTPFGPGIWPAFWMLGSDVETNAWPNCGEIDIMELRGQKPNIINGTVHGPGYSGGNAITKAYGLQNGRFDTDFHVFGVEWTKSQIDFFVDGYLYQRIKSTDVSGEWVYNHPFYMILNVAVGGNYVGFPTDETPFPQKMYIDYVRVYKQK